MNALPTHHSMVKNPPIEELLHAWGLRHPPFEPDGKNPAIFPAANVKITTP